MLFGGVVGGGTFEFDAPDVADNDSPRRHKEGIAYQDNPSGPPLFRSRRQRGRKANIPEEADDRVFFLELLSDKWQWSKPIVHGGSNRPAPRSEHSACKIGTNDVAIFGGWAAGPMNDLWIFNYIDMEWTEATISGIRPKPRYRHTCELIENKLYILGGSDNIDDVPDGCKYLGIHCFHLDTMEWTHPELKGVNPFPRSGHTSAVLGAHSIAIFGGKRTDDIFLNDMIIIDTKTWQTTVVNAVQNKLPMPIAYHSMRASGNKCLVFGGQDVKGNCYNDIRLLDISEYLDANDITVGAGASSDYSFKIIIIGDASVGKSALLTRFSDNVFLQSYTTTIGIDFNSKMIRVDKAICKLEIWDTAGQERFSTITANYYRGAQGALLVYDVGNRESFEKIQAWYDRAKQLGGENMETVMIGNKNDLSDDERQVTTLEGEQMASSFGIHFLETSALTGNNVEKAFVTMTGTIKKSVTARGLIGVQASSVRKAGGVALAKGESKITMKERCCT